MMIMIAAAALAAGQPAPADPHAQPAPMSGMDMSRMDHSKMDRMGRTGGCCEHKADAKMDCCAEHKSGGPSDRQGQSGH